MLTRTESHRVHSNVGVGGGGGGGVHLLTKRITAGSCAILCSTLIKGEPVRIRTWVNSDWVVASTNDDRATPGLVPTAYLTATPSVEVLLQLCTARGDLMQSIDKLVEPSAGGDVKSTVAAAVCDTTPDNELELPLSLGETVTLIRWVDENWLLATAKDGTMGIVAANILTPHPTTILPHAKPIAHDA
jgi:hypothetical protein